MKRIGLFLLAVVMMVGAIGMVGCSSGDDNLTAADMAGTYINFLNDGTPFATLTLRGDGSCTVEGGGFYPDTGTFTVDDPHIYTSFPRWGSSEYDISNGGKTLTRTDGLVWKKA